MQGSCGYGSRYPYAAKGAVRQRHRVDAQKTRCRWCINRPELPRSISAEDWNRNSRPEEQNQTSLHLSAGAIFFLFAPRGFAGSFQLAQARAWHSSRTKIYSEFTFHPHPHHAALTLASREQGEGKSDTGEGMVSATHLTRTLTPAGWVSIPGLYC